MSQLERIAHFHQQIEQGCYPAACDLAQTFEVSLSTAHRDIAYLRDRLKAPLLYDRKHNGYFYTESEFKLPFERSPAMLLLFSVLNRLAEDAGLAAFPEMEELQRWIGNLYCTDYQRIADKIICEHIEVEPAAPAVLRSALIAFHKDRRLFLRYENADGITSSRKVDPLRLVNYQGRWYLFAYCRMRKALRMFHMARIKNSEVLTETCDCSAYNSQDFLGHSFGIFKGEPIQKVKILFTGATATIVKRQLWHPEQRMEETKEGTVLDIPVADFTEIKMKVLQYGCHARVLAPHDFAKEIAEEAVAMAKCYACEVFSQGELKVASP